MLKNITVDEWGQNGIICTDGGAFRQVADVCLTVPFASTPQVESFHLALEHLITFCLKEKIANCR